MPGSPSGNQYRRTCKASIAQIFQRFIRLLQWIAMYGCMHRYLRRQGQELITVAAGEVGY